MNRETKLGLCVGTSFLSLVAVLAYNRWNTNTENISAPPDPPAQELVSGDRPERPGQKDPYFRQTNGQVSGNPNAPQTSPQGSGNLAPSFGENGLQPSGIPEPNHKKKEDRQQPGLDSQANGEGYPKKGPQQLNNLGNASGFPGGGNMPPQPEPARTAGGGLPDVPGLPQPPSPPAPLSGTGMATNNGGLSSNGLPNPPGIGGGFGSEAGNQQMREPKTGPGNGNRGATQSPLTMNDPPPTVTPPGFGNTMPAYPNIPLKESPPAPISGPGNPPSTYGSPSNPSAPMPLGSSSNGLGNGGGLPPVPPSYGPGFGPGGPSNPDNGLPPVPQGPGPADLGLNRPLPAPETTNRPDAPLPAPNTTPPAPLPAGMGNTGNTFYPTNPVQQPPIGVRDQGFGAPPVPVPQNDMMRNPTAPQVPMIPSGTGAVTPPISINSGQTGTQVAVAPPPGIGAMTPEVTQYDEHKHLVRAGETSFAAVSATIYGSDQYGQALLEYNRTHPLGRDAAAQPNNLTPGASIYYPPEAVLAKRYAAALTPQAPQNPSPVPPISVPSPQPAPRPMVPVVPAPSTFNTPPPGAGQPITQPFQPQTGGMGVSPMPTVAQPAMAPAVSTRNYTIVPGGPRFMYELAQDFLGNGQRWGEIYRLNPDFDPQSPIAPGMVVRLPVDGN